MENNDLIQTINQLNETIQILQGIVATQNATILELKQVINDRLNVTVIPTEPTEVILVPSADEIDRHRSKFAKFQRIPFI